MSRGSARNSWRHSRPPNGSAGCCFRTDAARNVSRAKYPLASRGHLRRACLLEAVAKKSAELKTLSPAFVATFVGSGIFRPRPRQRLRQRCKTSVVMKRLYRLLFHMVCRKRALEFAGHEESFEAGLHSTKEYFDRFDNLIVVKDKRVLDVGCGYGGTCIYVAERGAKRVVGIDIDEERLETAKEKLRMAYPGLKGKVEYKLVSADEDM